MKFGSLSLYWLVMLPLLLRPALAAEPAKPLTDLTPQSVCVHNHLAGLVMRGGKPLVFDGPPPAEQIRQPGKYAEFQHVDFWFPQPKAPTVSRVEFQMGGADPVAWHVQVWTEAGWKTVATRDPAHPGPAKSLDFDPIPARGVRLLIEETYTIGFNQYTLAKPRVFGPEQTLAPPAKLKWTLEAKPELNIFQLGEEVVVSGSLQSSAGQADDLELHWQWVDWYQRPVSEPGKKALKVHPGKAAPISFRWQPTAQGPYFLRAEAWRHGAKAGEAVFLVGVRDPKMDENLEIEEYISKRSGRPRDEKDLLGPGKMLYGSEIYHFSSYLHYLPSEKWFKEFAEDRVDLVGALPNWEAVMPLPGVYNFAYFDHTLDLAERHGMLLETGYWRLFFEGENRPHWWLDDELIVSHTGKKGSDFNHAYSYFGPEFRKYMQRCVALIVKRYRNHPAVGVWNFQPYGHVDWGWMGDLKLAFDYSSWAQENFRTWLREKRGFTLEELSQRYGEKFATWNDVKLPVSFTFQEGALQSRSDHIWDGRPIWFDFVEWRHQATAEAGVELWKLVRRYDPVRPMGSWMSIVAGAGELNQRLLADYAIPGGSNGAQWTEYVRMSIAQRRYGRDSRQEHGGQIDGRSPDSAGLMNQMIFNNNIFRTKYFNYVFPVFEQNPAWELFANPRCREILEEMADAEIPHSPVGAIHSYDSDWFEGRNSLGFIELDRWWRMLAWGEYATSQRWVEWYSNTTLDGLKNQAVVIDNHSRVMRPEAIDALYKYVVNGGHLVLWSNSGQYTYGKVAPQWELLKRLGYDDVSSLEKTTRHGIMKPVSGNGILTSFSEIPMGDWTPLHKPDATVLAKIDEKPAALTWAFGKGKVLLISGEEIGPEIQELVALEPPPGKKDPVQGKIYWDARVKMRTGFIQTVQPLYQDLVNFAGKLPEKEWSVAGVQSAYYKRKALDQHYLCLYNPDEKQPTGKITASLKVPTGTYDVRLWTLEDYRYLGELSAEELANGLELEQIPPMRMRTLQVKRIH